MTEILVDDDRIRLTINWDCSRAEMKAQLERMIKSCRKNGKVIPLPLMAPPGGPTLQLLSLLVGQVNCESCDALCCRSSKDDIIQLTSEDLLRLARFGVSSTEIKAPCRFLDRRRCSIYDERPLVCVFYPFQPGGAFGAGKGMEDCLSVASSCPEARRVAKRVYMARWEFRRQLVTYQGIKNI